MFGFSKMFETKEITEVKSGEIYTIENTQFSPQSGQVLIVKNNSNGSHITVLPVFLSNRIQKNDIVIPQDVITIHKTELLEKVDVVSRVVMKKIENDLSDFLINGNMNKVITIR